MNTQNNQNQIPVAPSPTPVQSGMVEFVAQPATQPPVNPAANTTFTPSFINFDDDEENIELRRQEIKQEEGQIDSMLTELEQTGFEQLVDKYTLNRLSILVMGEKPVSNRSVVDEFLSYRQFLVSDFIKTEAMKTFSPKLKDQILALLAALKPDENPQNIAGWLQQISPDTVLPTNIKIAEIQPQAQKLWQASENIKKIIVEGSYGEYEGDVTKVLRLPESQFNELSKKMKAVSEEVAAAYEPANVSAPASPELVTKVLNVFGDFGRTPMFIEEMKQENIFGNMAEIYIKLEYALEIAEAIKAKNLPQPINEETINQEIKNYLSEHISLK